MRNEYIYIRFFFNNILKHLLLQHKVKGSIFKCYFIGGIILKLSINIMKYDSGYTLIFTHLSLFSLRSRKTYCRYTNLYGKNLHAIYSLIATEENKEGYYRLSFFLPVLVQ
jgi:hypothetical protein